MWRDTVSCWTQKVISPPEFDRHQTAYTTARERAAALEAQLGHAVNQLAYTELAADRDGVVTALEVETGQVVSAGQAVVKVAQLDEKEIHFDVPEHRLPGLKRPAGSQHHPVGRSRKAHEGPYPRDCVGGRPGQPHVSCQSDTA